jgi:hypothetical protein
MMHGRLGGSRSRILRRLAFIVLSFFSGGVCAEDERSAVPDSMLLDYARSSLNLSLCAVVFDEEFEDMDRASRYQNGSIRAEMLIQEGGWSRDETLRAHDFVLREGFSFTLPPDTTWSSFRRSHFDKDRCERALAKVARERA